MVKNDSKLTVNLEIFARVLLSQNLRMQSLAKKNWQNGKNSLSYTDVSKSCQSLEFLTWLIVTLFAKTKFL